MDQRIKEALLLASAYQDDRLVNLLSEIEKNGIKDEATSDTKFSNYIGLASGFYKVGHDIAEGEYILNRDEECPYNANFRIYSDSRFTKKSMLCEKHFKRRMYVTVNNGEYLELEDCTIIEKV